jgi:hypothetical protein
MIIGVIALAYFNENKKWPSSMEDIKNYALKD